MDTIDSVNAFLVELASNYGLKEARLNTDGQYAFRTRTGLYVVFQAVPEHNECIWLNSLLRLAAPGAEREAQLLAVCQFNFIEGNSLKLTLAVDPEAKVITATRVMDVEQYDYRAWEIALSRFIKRVQSLRADLSQAILDEKLESNDSRNDINACHFLRV